MSIAFVQGTGGLAGTGKITTRTFGSSTTTGNCLVVAAMAYCEPGIAYTDLTCTDNKGNTYTLQVHESTTSPLTHLLIWTCANAAGGSSHTITLNDPSSNIDYREFAIAEFSGVALSGEVAGHASASHFASTDAGPALTGSITVANPGSAIVVVMSHVSGSVTLAARDSATEIFKDTATSGVPLICTYLLGQNASLSTGVTLGGAVKWTVAGISLNPGGSPPAAPTSVTVDVLDASSVAVSWSDNSDATITSFTLQYSTDNTFATYTQAVINAGTTATISAANLESNTTYYFRVRATNASGNSDWSTPSSAVIVPVPDVPTHLTVASVGPTVAAAGWQASSGADTYDLRYAASASFAGATTLTGITALVKTITGLTQRQTYYLQVRGTNDAGSSAWSRPVSVRAGDPPGSGGGNGRKSRVGT